MSKEYMFPVSISCLCKNEYKTSLVIENSYIHDYILNIREVAQDKCDCGRLYMRELFSSLNMFRIEED